MTATHGFTHHQQSTAEQHSEHSDPEEAVGDLRAGMRKEASLPEPFDRDPAALSESLESPSLEMFVGPVVGSVVGSAHGKAASNP
ncbi:hypothetical protein [uncultured Aeromicrobium sp.]|uniref:hypothetical protein n=1 Tax=uncultured Aeromicrobium sp. TaxID=337820 RepID=UPI0025F9223F|nr:hypothetical protein [uncultured Aeromicrobium sp.]